MKKVLVCMGTRPEIIKLAPIVKELRARNVDVIVCATGQHTNMAEQAFSAFGLQPDYNLEILNRYEPNGLSSTAAAILDAADKCIKELKPDLLLVQGDTTTVFSCALAAYHNKVKIAHVEAGLRTGNLYSPWPEEGYRSMVTMITDYHFAPTEISRANLRNAGVSDNRIFVVGNTVVDSLYETIRTLEKGEVTLNLPDVILNSNPENKMILVTGHRRENFESGLRSVFNAVKKIAESNSDTIVVIPAHFNPSVRSVIRDVFVKDMPNVYIIDAVAYREFVWLMQRARFIITDSGGVQEEAPTMGRPVLLTRDTTERPEGVGYGVTIVGTDGDRIIVESERLLRDDVWYELQARPNLQYGNGKSAQSIVDVLFP